MSRTAYICFGTPLKPAKVNLKTQRQFVKAVNEVLDQNYDKLVVSITSEGGYCEDGFIMYHALRQAADHLQVHTHAVLDCSSMAGVMHMAGDVRTYATATIFSLHAASKDDEVDPVYNSRVQQVYMDRAGWSKQTCDKYFTSTVLVEPVVDELEPLRIVTDAKRYHFPSTQAHYTIN